MTAALIIVGLAALAASAACTTSIAVTYSLWRSHDALSARFLDAEDNRRRLLADKGTLSAQVDDLKATRDRLNGVVDDLGRRLKLAEARAVAGLSDDELRTAINGLPPHGDGARAVPGAGAGGEAAAVPHVAAAAAPAGTRGGMR